MSIGIIGMSLLGIATAAAFANAGQAVICTDMDDELVTAVKELELPGFEKDLDQAVQAAQNSGKLSFSAHLRGVIKNCELLMITCEVPEMEEGAPSLRFVKEIVRSIAAQMETPKTIVLRATLPPGSAAALQTLIQDVIDEREEKFSFELLVAPVLGEPGHWLKEITHPKLALIGAESIAAAQPLVDVYQSIGYPEDKICVVPFKEAEMAPYARNTMLALKKAWINELAQLCEAMEIDLKTITKVMGKERELSAFGMSSDPGFGGSEIPKSVRSLVKIAEEHHVPAALAAGALAANADHKHWCVRTIDGVLDGLEGKTIAVLGLVPESGSDDLREAPALDIVQGLVSGGAKLQIFDKNGYQQAKWRLFKEKEALLFAKDLYEAASGADALVVLSAARPLRIQAARLAGAMKGRVLIDFQNLFAGRDEFMTIFEYHHFG